MPQLALNALSHQPAAAALRAFNARESCPTSSQAAPTPQPRQPSWVEKALPLSSLVRAAVGSLAQAEAAGRIDLDLDVIHGALHPPVQAEPIAHALLNLLTNACRYSSPATRIRVRSALQWADGGQYVVLTICDRGIGMSRAHQQRAFEPYWQAPGVHAGPGRGLGLSVARKLIDAQGGWLELRSALGIGTEVDLWLPLALSAGRAA